MRPDAPRARAIPARAGLSLSEPDPNHEKPARAGLLMSEPDPDHEKPARAGFSATQGFVRETPARMSCLVDISG